MNGKTAINATNFIIADLRDESIGDIDFSENEKIEYLPYKIFMQLPNLGTYDANECAIKQISKENFEKLSRLRVIELNSNKIQKVSGNTFKGLESLAHIDLSEFLSFKMNCIYELENFQAKIKLNR